MRRIPLLAGALILSWASIATAAPQAASPLEQRLGVPSVRIQGGVVSLKARPNADPSTWSCRLYFDTDLNAFTGWLPSRGYEYVACPNPAPAADFPVSRTKLDSNTGEGGALTGNGAEKVSSSAVEFNVPLSAMGDDDGHFAWELMVFDASGTWVGSYAGRILQ